MGHVNIKSEAITYPAARAFFRYGGVYKKIPPMVRDFIRFLAPSDVIQFYIQRDTTVLWMVQCQRLSNIVAYDHAKSCRKCSRETTDRKMWNYYGIYQNFAITLTQPLPFFR